MKTARIVADGPDRLRKGQMAMGGGGKGRFGNFWRRVRGQKAPAPESLENKYSAELAKATPAEKEKIYQRMMEEQSLREKMANHEPSAKALW